jgi:hypothetical protein
VRLSTPWEGRVVSQNPEWTMDASFAVDDPSGHSIRAPAVALPEKALRCGSTPGAALALVRRKLPPLFPRRR